MLGVPVIGAVLTGLDLGLVCASPDLPGNHFVYDDGPFRPLYPATPSDPPGPPPSDLRRWPFGALILPLAAALWIGTAGEPNHALLERKSIVNSTRCTEEEEEECLKQRWRWHQGAGIWCWW